MEVGTQYYTDRDLIEAVGCLTDDEVETALATLEDMEHLLLDAGKCTAHRRPVGVRFPGATLPSKLVCTVSRDARELCVPDTRYRGEYAEAYVRALALAAGLNVATSAVDDGIDAQIRYTSEDEHPVLRNWPGVDLQVKSWSTPSGRQDFWSFSGLNEQQYNKLVGDFTFPRYLVVLIVPADRWLLTEVRDDGLLLRHCAYYTKVPGPRVAHPDPSRRKGVRVPKRNVLTAESLRHLVSPQLVAQRSAP